jgi:hypothetical protein
MTEIQDKIFRKVKEEWEKRVGKGNVDEKSLKKIIEIADTNGDGKKRIIIEGKTYLVPIEDIILKGISGREVKEKYPEGTGEKMKGVTISFRIKAGNGTEITKTFMWREGSSNDYNTADETIRKAIEFISNIEKGMK